MTTQSTAPDQLVSSFVVRIYRRGGRENERLVGVVQGSMLNSVCGFTSSDELWQILTAVGQSTPLPLDQSPFTDEQESNFESGERR